LKIFIQLVSGNDRFWPIADVETAKLSLRFLPIRGHDQRHGEERDSEKGMKFVYDFENKKVISVGGFVDISHCTDAEWRVFSLRKWFFLILCK